MGPQVLQQRALQPAAVGTVRTAEGFLAAVDAHVTPKCQFGGELPVTERATESQILVLFCFLSFNSLLLPVLRDALRQTDLISAGRTGG